MRDITKLWSKTFALTAAAATAGLFGVSAQADERLEKEILGPRVAQNTANARSQAAIDRMANDSDTKLAKLKQELDTIDNLKKYNDRLRNLIQTQEEDKTSTQRQIDGVTNVERNILPLMDDMIAALETFVAVDVPFLMEERTTRIASLKELMEQADVTVAEKYRRLTEAYQIENEYGRSMDAYSASLEDGREVEFLRVGRVLLIYRTPDGDETKFWDKSKREWVELDGSYRNAVDQGIRIARKQSPPDLITLPVQAPGSAGGN